MRALQFFQGRNKEKKRKQNENKFKNLQQMDEVTDIIFLKCFLLRKKAKKRTILQLDRLQYRCNGSRGIVPFY